MRTQEEVDVVLEHLRQGLTASEAARITGIPRSAIRDWRDGRCLQLPRSAPLGCAGHDFAALDGAAYAYLLGMYLGDGCLSEHRRGVWRLRITLDAAYPGIIAECTSAIESVLPG